MTSARPVSQTDTASQPGRLMHSTAFWILVAILLAFMWAAAAPSPLYAVYQAKWHFSAITLTVVFAVYAFALLAALVTVGSLSDHIGRRPALLAALTAQALAMVVFILAEGSGWLLAARILQGVATGLAQAAVSASLVDLRPTLAPLVNTIAPGIGLGFGALGSGLLVQYAPAPTKLVFVLIIGACVAAAIGVLRMPETSPRRPGALTALRPSFGVSRATRGRFLAVTPILITSWSMTGFYMSLGPSLAIEVFGLSNRLMGGLLVCCLMGTSACSGFLARGLRPRTAIIVGVPTLVAGLGGTVLALHTAWPPLLFLSTMLTGAGFGAAFLGAFGTVAALAEPDRRAALFATMYTVTYSAFSLPAIAAGFATTAFGLSWTAHAYAIAVAAIAATGLATALLQLPRE